MIDVAAAIDGEAVPVTRIRHAAGTYDADGKWIPGASTSLLIGAAIQPASGNQLRDMPEGIRAEAGWMLWSRADIAMDDQIRNAGITYRVIHVWPRAEGAFFRAALGREKK